MSELVPRRTITKLDAIRHLLHAAIRLHLAEEDAFVINSLTHSCEVLIGDYARGMHVEILDIDSILVQDRKKEFYRQYRRTYNYFKHADKDFSDALDVFDTVRANEFGILLNISRCFQLGVANNQHMSLFLTYVITFFPNVPQFINIPAGQLLSQHDPSWSYRTRGEALSLMREAAEANAAFIAERELDLQDVRRASSARFADDVV